MLYNMFPWLVRHLPGPHRRMLAVTREIVSFVEERIKEHRVDHDPSSPRDYIDCFLTEMLKGTMVLAPLNSVLHDESMWETPHSFNPQHFLDQNGLSRKREAFLPFSAEQVQAELDTVVGSSRQPSWSDRDSTPYTYAVIQETQRMGNIIPLNVFRMTTRDTTLGKYTIPKGTMVMATLHSVLHDESMWETPHSFNPQHFLDQNGLSRKREAFLPFSAGKRVCPGEQLARMELYLFFTSLLQRFSFSAPPGEKLSLDFILGTTHCPKPYRLCATPR
ncbi:hypothetical protein NHX12_033981 [Muraenolepis orangiensis]|uniref:Cytochrome P450 n=1 Tax=Muraenolepis orangiensis TaxID=630683 RepID=A0A9Q0E4S1_9TELE|nr:hypothetical protein NHX12_033981 [Muraenolepis orangiensis]